jgi:hypothetical protein
MANTSTYCLPELANPSRCRKFPMANRNDGLLGTFDLSAGAVSPGALEWRPWPHSKRLGSFQRKGPPANRRASMYPG